MVSLRDVTIVWDETGDGMRVTSGTGSAQRFVENWKEVRELKAVVKTGALKVLEADQSYPSLLRPICCDKRVSNNQLSHAPRHHQREGRGRTRQKVNFLNYSDHTWIKTTAIFSSLTFEFEYYFFCGFLSLQHKTLILWYNVTPS